MPFRNTGQRFGGSVSTPEFGLHRATRGCPQFFVDEGVGGFIIDLSTMQTQLLSNLSECLRGERVAQPMMRQVSPTNRPEDHPVRLTETIGRQIVSRASAAIPR